MGEARFREFLAETGAVMATRPGVFVDQGEAVPAENPVGGQTK